ncbi:MAG: hypothetical protein R3E32_01050 [Chitinophagales bacterium]
MKNLLFFVSILFILNFYSSCKKNNAETVHIPQEFKDYTVFPEGSWWIYEEKHTGIKDSTYTYFSKCKFSDGRRFYGRDFGEVESCEFVNVSRGDSITSQSIFLGKNEDKSYIYIYIETNHSKTQTLNNHLLIHPIDSLPQQVPTQGGHIITALDDTLSVGGRQYFNTISTSTDGVVSENGAVPFNIKTCIFAKGIGKVYIHYHDGTIWELVDYHIAD